MESERAQGHPVGGDDTLTTDTQQRRGNERRRERSGRAGGERRLQLPVQAALTESHELEQSRAADNRQPSAPGEPRGRLTIAPKRERRGERGAITRDARNKRRLLSQPDEQAVRPR